MPFQAVDRAVAILEALEEGRGRTLAQLARSCGLSEATTLRYLTSLVEHGFVDRDETGSYGIGVRLFQLGQQAFADADPRRVALPVMDELLERFNETVTLGVRRRDRLVVVEALTSRHSIRRGAMIGEDDSWHSTGLGKAILAYVSSAEMRRLLEHEGMPRLTQYTITSVEHFERELARIRRAGYAIDDEESELGLRCVAAPVFDARGVPRFALSVSGPSNRLTRRHYAEIGSVVRDAARRTSAALGYSPIHDIAGATG